MRTEIRPAMPVPNKPPEINSPRGIITRNIRTSGEDVTSYHSVIGTFGGGYQSVNGRMVYFLNKRKQTVDRIGDGILREFDEHTLPAGEFLRWLFRSPLSLRHYREGIKLLTAKPKRSRGTVEEIARNIAKISWKEDGNTVNLRDFYVGYRPEESGDFTGIELTQAGRDMYKTGAYLLDMVREVPGIPDEIRKKDRFSAYKEAAAFLSNVHRNSNGGIGEVLAADIIFYDEGRKIGLSIPDIIYRERTIQNGQKSPSKKEQQATDLLDFLMSVSLEEYRRSVRFFLASPLVNPELERDAIEANVRLAMNAVVIGYSQLDGGNSSMAKDIVRATHALLVRGRLSLQGDEGVIASERQQLSQAVLQTVNQQRELAQQDPIAYTPSTKERRHWFFPVQHNRARFGINEIGTEKDQRQLVAYLRKRLIDVTNIS